MSSDDKKELKPSKYDILNEILRKDGTNLIGKSIKHPELLGGSRLSINTNPFNPSDHEYLMQAFLSGPSHLGTFSSARLEVILKKLLKDEYDKYYDAAKNRITKIH